MSYLLDDPEIDVPPPRSHPNWRIQPTSYEGPWHCQLRQNWLYDQSKYEPPEPPQPVRVRRLSPPAEEKVPDKPEAEVFVGVGLGPKITAVVPKYRKAICQARRKVEAQRDRDFMREVAKGAKEDMEKEKRKAKAKAKANAKAKAKGKAEGKKEAKSEKQQDVAETSVVC